MEFSPFNPIVKRCLQGIELEEQGKQEEAGIIFQEAWKEATHDLEKFLAAYFIGRNQRQVEVKLKWYQTALSFALAVNDDSVIEACATLYTQIATCYEELNDPANANLNHELSRSLKGKPVDKGPFYHGTKAVLKPGDYLYAGFGSNYQSDLIMNHIYFTGLLNGAGLAATMAKGEGTGHVFIVEPTGDFQNDPNVTDKKFPGNLTRSYRTEAPLKITGEIQDWIRQMPEEMNSWREKLTNNKGKIIN